MKKKTSLLRGAFFLVAFSAALAFGVRAETARADTGAAGLLDMIVMGGKASGVKGELPPVPFSHAPHQVVEDCSACHTPPASEGGYWSWEFKNSSSALASGADYKDFYHSGCVTCHEEASFAGGKSGPGIAECRSCHLDGPAAPAAGQRATVDFSMGSELHDRHVSSGAIPGNEDGLNCGSCHHVYDAEAKKLVPDYEPSENCRSCHGDTASANPDNPGGMIPSYRVAAHMSCVSCHFDMGLPASCDSCHSLAGK